MAGTQEYRRTCMVCGKVWHSLVAREAQISRNEKANTCNAVGQCCNPAAQLQAKRNLEANQSEIAQLHQCPNCHSANYQEVIIDHAPPSQIPR
jgi:hypothetical protein